MLAARLVVVVAELLLEDRVEAARLLLLAQLVAVLGLAHATTKQALLNLADQAMYRGKESTRNVVYLAHSQNAP